MVNKKKWRYIGTWVINKVGKNFIVYWITYKNMKYAKYCLLGRWIWIQFIKESMNKVDIKLYSILNNICVRKILNWFCVQEKGKFAKHHMQNTKIGISILLRCKEVYEASFMTKMTCDRQTRWKDYGYITCILRLPTIHHKIYHNAKWTEYLIFQIQSHICFSFVLRNKCFSNPKTCICVNRKRPSCFWNELSWVYWCFTSHTTIFQSYMWRHRCAGGLKKKWDLRSGMACKTLQYSIIWICVCDISICVCNIWICVCNISICVCNISICVCNISICVCNISICVCNISICVCNISICVCNIWICVWNFSICVCNISICVCNISICVCNFSIYVCNFFNMCVQHFDMCVQHFDMCVQLFRYVCATLSICVCNISICVCNISICVCNFFDMYGTPN